MTDRYTRFSPTVGVDWEALLGDAESHDEVAPTRTYSAEEIELLAGAGWAVRPTPLDKLKCFVWRRR